MVVLNVVNCPLQLRGDLTKWMLEIDAGVYVGKLNARTRELLWKRVCDNIRSGKASMVFSCNNEQGYGFYTHNTMWKPEDYDGVTLIKKYQSIEIADKDAEIEVGLQKGFSKAAKYHRNKVSPISIEEYVVLDIETSGLDSQTDFVMEIGMLYVRNGMIADRFQCMIKPQKTIPEGIVKLTGITYDMLEKDGEEELSVFEKLNAFIGSKEIVGYNTDFDLSFLEAMAKRLNQELEITRVKDVMKVAKRKLKGLNNYKLKTVAEHLGCDMDGMHRALRDCEIVQAIYEELNKI